MYGRLGQIGVYSYLLKYFVERDHEHLRHYTMQFYLLHEHGFCLMSEVGEIIISFDLTAYRLFGIIDQLVSIG